MSRLGEREPHGRDDTHKPGGSLSVVPKETERPSNNRRLVRAIARHLFGEKSLAAELQRGIDITRTIFVTLDAPGALIHLRGHANTTVARESGNFVVSATFIDPKNNQVGTVESRDRRDKAWVADATINRNLSEVDLSDRLEEWDSRGGTMISLRKPVSDMSDEEIGIFADRLEKAQPNADMTLRALTYLEENMNGEEMESNEVSDDYREILEVAS